MSDEQPTTDEHTAAIAPAEHAAAIPSEPLEQDEVWLEDTEELPPRPRRRVLTPLPLALLAALAIACGFIAGVLVEKGQGGSSSAGGTGGGALASRLSALRGGGARSGASSGSSSASASSAPAAEAGAAGGLSRTGGRTGAGGAGATIGQVAFVSKGTLYVTTTEGDTVKVTAATGASITKTVKAKVASIHPGETVIVTGATAANGAVAASAIRVGSAGAGGLGGGGAALFGASGGSGSGSGTSGSSSSSSSGSSSGGGNSGGGTQLFGNGG
jgi:hypothetical protein